MNTHKPAQPKHAKPKAPVHVENSTDATRGEPLGIRAQKRRTELEAALASLPADRLREQSDIQLALSSVDELMTGDLENPSEVVATGLNRWLEGTKHLAETHAKTRAKH